MDNGELQSALGSILNDPQSMDRVRSMAEQLLSQNTKKEPEQNDFGIDPTRLMGILSRLKSSGSSEREKLLLALKPHLSPERRGRVDTAIKMLKLIELAPLLKDSGLLEF